MVKDGNRPSSLLGLVKHFTCHWNSFTSSPTCNLLLFTLHVFYIMPWKIVRLTKRPHLCFTPPRYNQNQTYQHFLFIWLDTIKSVHVIMTKLMVSHVLSACFVIVYPIQACFGYVLVYLIRIKAKSNDLLTVDLLISLNAI